MTRGLLAGLSAVTFSQSDLHSTSRIWRETNCYTDLFIEIVHALGLDFRAGLGFTLASEFEVDQWTFFKPSTVDLYDLYGIDVEELTVWGAFLDRAEAQLEHGRIVMPEVDAYFLPDVAASDYKTAHSKTAIAITSLDKRARRLEYFHNGGMFELDGDDFDGLFDAPSTPADLPLPPYTEIVKLDRLKRRASTDLADVARRITQAYVVRRTRTNPFHAFGDYLDAVMTRMGGGDAVDYHAVTFALVRQCGSAHELAALHLRWLGRHGVEGLDSAEDALLSIAQTCQILVLKAARVVRSGKSGGFDMEIEELVGAWDRAWSVIHEKIRP